MVELCPLQGNLQILEKTHMLYYVNDKIKGGLPALLHDRRF